MGSLIKTEKVLKETTTINLKKLPPGLYFIRIELPHKIFKKKLIKL